ncbi:MAG TPA: sugar phosphate isomerase/epimerase family protein [Terriglobia bacterium]|nr:sugar phosphate isomerase/epimerase family protein [Terriglobia bacterium]
MRNFSRREFLGSLAIGSLVAGSSAAALGRAASVAGPHFDFPTAPRQRLAVTSYPFRELIDSPTNQERDKSKPGMDLKDFAAMVVRRFGVHNINPLGAHFRSTDSGYLQEFRAAVAKAGSHLVDLGLGGGHFWDPELSRVQASIDYGKKWIDIAVVLGSPSVRQHLNGSPHVRPDVTRAAANLGRLADYGATKGIAVNLENDSLRNEDPFFIVEVIEKVGNPYLRALPDFGNSIRGHDAAYNQRAVAKMFQHAFNMAHVKDTVAGDDGKLYKIDLAKMFAIAKASGYRGYFSMEWEDSAGDPFYGTERLIRESLRYL